MTSQIHKHMVNLHLLQMIVLKYLSCTCTLQSIRPILPGISIVIDLLLNTEKNHNFHKIFNEFVLLL